MRKDPPIVELALTLTFDPLQGLTVLDCADLYRRDFESKYPIFQQAPRLPPVAVNVSPVQLPQFEMLSGMELPRLWFLGADTRDLVQVQSDRLSQNWRRISAFGEPDEYPGYFTVRDKFIRSFEAITHIHSRAGIANIPFRAAELIYVNMIPLRREGMDDLRLSEVLAFYRPLDKRPIGNFHASWIEPVENQQASIRVVAAAHVLPDGGPAINLTMTGVADTAGLTLSQALAKLDLLHDKIHETFDRVLTPTVTDPFKV